MKKKAFVVSAFLGLALLFVLAAAAKTAGNAKDKDAGVATSTTTSTAQDDPMRLEGEKRFHSNCGRCHTAPPKFAPRMMATIIRHMRVRATITDQEMRSILHYMTQ